MASRSHIPTSTRRKVEGTLHWIERQPDYLTGRHPTLSTHHWFTINDVLGVLLLLSRVTMWAEPENSSLPGWADWMLLEGSSESGDGEQLSFPALLMALQPDRFNGVLSGAHFRVWKTPPFPLEDIPILLARMLLQELSGRPTDPRICPDSTYTTLRSTSAPSPDCQPRIIPAYTIPTAPAGPLSAPPLPTCPLVFQARPTADVLLDDLYAGAPPMPSDLAPISSPSCKALPLAL